MVSPPVSLTVHLLAHAALQLGLDVPEEQVRLAAVRCGQLGIEVREDVEVGPQGRAVVHIRGVHARPEKRFSAGHPLQAREIDLAGREQVGVLLREIVAHHGDDLHGREVAGGEGDIGGGPAEHAIDFSVRRFHAIVSDRPYDN